jgi:UDP-2,3-diacylglucosamine pyrophosphatase LpxH
MKPGSANRQGSQTMHDALILSDLHLGADNAQVSQMVSFFDAVRARTHGLATRCLILNGDVFDSFDMRRLSKTHWKVLTALRKLTKHIEVHWITGNHDPDSELLSCLLGVEAHDEMRFQSGSKRILCLHGHAFDSFVERYPRITALADGAYRVLQWVDRSHRVARLAKKSSKTFLRCTNKVRDRAISLAVGRSVDIVCCGHTHLAEEHTDPATGIQYFNSGSWVEKPCTYLAVREGLVELRRFDQEEAPAPPVESYLTRQPSHFLPTLAGN